MKIIIKIITALCFIIFFCNVCYSQTGSMSQRLHINIDATGKAILDIEIPNQQRTPYNQLLAAAGYSVSFLLVPFEYSSSSWVIHSAPDVRASVLSHGTGYTMLCLLHPVGKSPIKISFEGAVLMDETGDDNAKIEFDFSYPFLSEADTAVKDLPQTVSLWDVTFVLSKEHSKYSVNTHPKAIIQVDSRSYNLPLKIVQQSPGKVWIVFPDPRKAKLSYAMIVLGFLFGILTALFQIIPLKERRVAVLVIIFFVSAIFLTVAIYLLLTLLKELELAIFFAAALPHVLLSGIASLYLLAAKRLQATIGGTISLDKNQTNLAEVRLFKCHNGEEKVVAKKERVDRGQYEFHIWVRKPTNLKVVAKSKITEAVESPIFEIKPRDTHPVGELCLVTPRILQDIEDEV
jgi:uncharacterized protein YlaI